MLKNRKSTNQYLLDKVLIQLNCSWLFPLVWSKVLFIVLMITSYSNVVNCQSRTDIQDILQSATILGWTNPDSAVLILKNRFESYSPRTESLEKAHVAMAISKAYIQKRDCNSLARWNSIAEQLYLENNDLQGKAEVLYQKGYHAYCNDDDQKALDYVLQGLKIMESLNDDAGIARGHLWMAEIFHFTLKVEQSAEYGRLAGERFENLGNYPDAWDAWGLAGHGYRMAGDGIQALECFEKGMEMAKRTAIPNILARAYNDIASYYRDFGLHDKAEANYKQALELAEPGEFMVIKNGLGQVYLNSGQYQKCIDVLDGMIDTAIQNGETFFLTEIPEYLAQSYAALGQYDSAYKYMEMSWRYSDSIFEQNQDKALEEMKAKYESDKKDQLIARQKIERRNGWVLFGLVSLLALLIYRGYLVKKRTSKELRLRNKEKDFLLKEIHHRVKNNLQILSSLLNIQADYIKDENALHAINEGRNRVQSMAFIHQQLYSDNHLAAVNMKDYMAELCGHLTDTFSSDQKKIDIEYDVQVEFFDVDTAIPLGLIVNELITNSIKYAFNYKDNGTIKVMLWLNEAGQLCLLVKDDGSGIADGVDVSEKVSFGTDMVKILSQKLKGKIELNTDAGYSTKITFDRFKVVEA